jgi:hypothetical protein
MRPRFNFEGAISSPFRAAHFGSFPWIFSAAYAALGTILFMLLMFLARDAFADMVTNFEALDQFDSVDDASPDGAFGLIFGAMSPLMPYVLLGTGLFWIFWSVFQAASMRRYVRDESFSLRFGADELNTMVVSIGWSILGALLYALPLILISGAFFAAIADDFSSSSEQRLFGALGGAIGLMVLLFPVYVFFATRLAPAFGLTIKERKIRFFDAWNVSRGRFWPILGAYVIIAVCGSIVASIIGQIFQLILMFAVVPVIDNANGPEDFTALFTSAGFLIGVAVYLFFTLFIGALQMHFNHGPAAFAARHDPRGSVDDVDRLDAFS